jgi:hypothetical protein
VIGADDGKVQVFERVERQRGGEARSGSVAKEPQIGDVELLQLLARL